MNGMNGMNKIILILSLIGIIISVIMLTKDQVTEHFVSKNGSDKDYDKDYAQIYKRVFADKGYIKYNIDQISKVVGKNKNYKILEAGCGVGNDTELIKKLLGDNVLSVDKSESFIKYFKYNLPKCNSKFGDLNYGKLFKNEQFDIILALHQTLYHNTKGNMREIINNFKKWLKPNGILVLHLYDVNKLDPAPREFSQYYENKSSGKHHALTHFDSFIHDSFWSEDDKDDKDVKYYNEKIIFRKSGNVMNNKHKFYYPDSGYIRGLLKDNGFKFVKEIDLKNIHVNDAVIAIYKK